MSESPTPGSADPRHNQAPAELPTTEAALSLDLDRATAGVKARLLTMRVALERIPDVITPEIEGAVSDQIRQTTITLGELDAIRVQHKEPYDKLGKLVQAHVAPIVQLVSEPAKSGRLGVLERVKKRLADHLAAKAKREREAQAAEEQKRRDEAAALQREADALEQQAAERARGAATTQDRRAAETLAEQAVAARSGAEQAEKAAAAPAAPTGRARGIGAQTHLVTTIKWRLKDLSKVPDAYTHRVINETAVQRAIDASAGEIEIPGIEIYEDNTAVTVGR